MTRKELVRHIEKHGCVAQPIKDGDIPVIFYYNPKTGKKKFIGTPIDSREEKRTIVENVCISLGIPVPLED